MRPDCTAALFPKAACDILNSMSNLASTFLPVAALVAGGLMGCISGRAADPDYLISTTGEKLVGELESATAKTVTFKSQLAGEVTVPWSKIKELHSSQTFAAIPKDTKVASEEVAKSIPEGAVEVAANQIEITPAKGAKTTVPVASIGYLVDDDTFQDSLQSPGFLGAWEGSLSLGSSLMVATQYNTSFSGEISLSRVVPGVGWRGPSNRTSIDFSTSYSWSHSTLATNMAKIKTYVYQGEAERDQYLSPVLFAYAQAIYNHNYSQNLDLQQTYQGGLGWSVLTTPKQDLDLKASAGYVDRTYYTTSFNKKLIASTFGESYRTSRKHGVKFHEEMSFVPAWNNSRAWAAAGSAGLSVPVSGNFSVDFNSMDSFLHAAPTGYKKNSFQLAIGLSYTLPE